MFRLNLGSGASAFEVVGEADQVRSISSEELVARKWPAEMVKNIERYQARLKHSYVLNRFDAEGQSLTGTSESGVSETGIAAATSKDSD